MNLVLNFLYKLMDLAGLAKTLDRSHLVLL